NEAIERIIEADIWVTPTLAHRTDEAIELRRQVGGTKYSIEKMKYLQPHCFETFQRMYRSGVNIAMGTDISYDPEMGNNSKELEIYVELGMTPMEAIQTATRNAAKAIGLEKNLGTIEVGKHADILAIEGNPLQDIKILQNREKIKIVMKDGNICVDRRPGQSKEVLYPQSDTWELFGT